MKTRKESGIALITVLLVLILMGALFMTLVVKINSSQKMIGMDARSDRTYSGGLAALGHITRLLAQALARTQYTLTEDVMNQQFLDNIANNALKSVSNLEFSGTDMETGQDIYVDNEGNKISLEATIKLSESMDERTITTGIHEGLNALVTTFTVGVTARSTSGEEVRLESDVQIYYIPAFQFSVFSESALEFVISTDSEYSGRVHTNSNLHIVPQSSITDARTLRLWDRISAVGNIYRKTKMSGYRVDIKNLIKVLIARPILTPRELTQEEGNDGTNYANAGGDARWEAQIFSQYMGYLRNGHTGARPLELPLVSGTFDAIEVIRRPPQNEDINTPEVYEQRFYSMSGLRILLSDTTDDIMNLPDIDGRKQPVLLQTVENNRNRVFAESSTAADFRINGTNSTSAGAPLIDGYIKIEIRTSDGLNSWRDVTNEILDYGYTGAAMTGSTNCTASTNAIIRLQRFSNSLTTANCTSYNNTPNPRNLWSNVLFDAREGMEHNGNPGMPNSTAAVSDSTPLYLGGLMHYVELDIANLGKWIRGAGAYASGSGSDVTHEYTGYVVYFSDRRGSQRDGNGNEIPRYLYENSQKDTDGDGVARTTSPPPSLDVKKGSTTYRYSLTFKNITNTGSTSNLSSATPPTPMNAITADEARRGRPVFFRRALKLVNGEKIELGLCDNDLPCGITIATENPLYIEKNYNATPAVFNGVGVGTCLSNCMFSRTNHSVPAAVIADAVTLLSNNWTDNNSFTYPYSATTSKRTASNTYYRTAIIGGKNKTFHYNVAPNARSSDEFWGSDGGVSNFLRMLEYWQTKSLYYDGSMVSLFNSHQANAPFKFRSTGNSVVYTGPSRNFYFDVEFKEMKKLPPRTPMLRDIDTLSIRRYTGDRD